MAAGGIKRCPTCGDALSLTASGGEAMCVRCIASMLSDSLDSYADEVGQMPEAGERYEVGKVLGR